VNVNNAYIYTQMEKRLWHQIGHHVNTARCFALELVRWWNLHICMWSPKFQLRMNVLMRPLRMYISDSFVKTFFPIQRQSISFFSVRLSSIYFHNTIGYLSLDVKVVPSLSFFFTFGDWTINHSEICMQASYTKNEGQQNEIIHLRKKIF
jgi:hypothetical protein